MVDYQGMIVPSAESGWVELSSDSSLALAKQAKGKLFKKQLLGLGKFFYRDPKTKVTQEVNVDEAFLETVKKNFDAGVEGVVQIPVADANNRHTHDPKSNIGEIIDVIVEDGKLYGVHDIRDTDAASKMGSTLLGASAYIDLEKFNVKTNEVVGPTLVHSCVTNYPYLPDLEEYKEILAASSDSIDNVAIFTESSENETETDTVNIDTVKDPKAPENKELEMSEEKPVEKTQDELLAELKEKHGIDVVALQELEVKFKDLESKFAALDPKPEVEAAKAEVEEKDKKIEELEAKAEESAKSEALVAALTKALQDVGVLELSNTTEEEVTPVDAINAVVELHTNVVSLSSKVEALELTNQKLETDRATAEVDADVAAGKILPAKRAAMLKLRLTNEEMYNDLLPAEPIVKFSNEAGDSPLKDEAEKVSAKEEAAKVLTQYAHLFTSKNKN